MAGLPHLVNIVIAAVIAAFLTAVLADGRSIIVLKDGTLPVVTNPAIVNASLTFLVGKTYGMGLHHDNTGRYWTELDPAYGTLNQIIAAYGVAGTLAALPTAISANALKNPVQFLECDDLSTSCIICMAIAYIGAGASLAMILAHGAALGGLAPTRIVKPFALFMWLVYVVCFLIVVIMGFSIYSAVHVCNNPVIATLKLDDSFDLGYGLPFACVGLAASVIALGVTAVSSTTSKGGPSKGGSSSTSSSN